MRSHACGSAQQSPVQRTVACSRCPAGCPTLTHSTPLPAARPRRLEALRQLVPHTERANTANFLEEVVGYVQRLQVRWGVQHALPHLHHSFPACRAARGDDTTTPALRWRLLLLLWLLLAPRHATHLCLQGWLLCMRRGMLSGSTLRPRRSLCRRAGKRWLLASSCLPCAPACAVTPAAVTPLAPPASAHPLNPNSPAHSALPRCSGVWWSWSASWACPPPCS